MEPALSRRRVDAVFTAALDCPPAERAGFLASACGDDAALRTAVEKLLTASEEPDSRLSAGAALSGPFWRELATELADPRPIAPGTRIGPFRVEREIGRGGMAEVYLAERADGQFQQQVALKLLRPGPADEDLARRFAQERQILATLEHPNIARILDGGVTEDGRPYFAMELVDGEPIDRYCDRRRLDVEARVRLFVDVAQAVEAAHRNLVIHRDLKPSNILVSLDGRVRLLDFGIAKPLDEGRDLRTRTDLRILTPEFASPEQLRGERVTTASDVYQLGLLLYLLLSGRQAHAITSRTPVAILEAVCLESPPPPSVVAIRPPIADDRVDAPSREEIARARATRPGRLRRQLRGDLDAIVAKALTKQAEERYASVGRLIADLERYLAGRPVMARRPSWAYRANKFLARNAVAAVAVALALVVIAGVVTFYTARLARERDRAQREAAKATRVASVLTDVFAAFDPFADAGREVTVRAILDHGAGRLEQELADQPEVRARLQVVLGDLYRKLGHFGQAERLLDAALQTQRAGLGDDHPDVARTHYAFGQLYRQQGRLSRARQAFETALAIQQQRLTPGDLDLASTLDQLADLLVSFEEPLAARAFAEKALVIREQALGFAHFDTLASRIVLADALRLAGERAAALTQLRRVEASFPADQADNPQTGVLLRSLGHALSQLGEPGAARVPLERSRSILEAALGRDHPQVASTWSILGLIAVKLGEREEALAAFERALAIRESLLPADSPSLLTAVHNVGTLLQELGRSSEALPYLERSLLSMERFASPESPHLIDFLEPLAEALAATGALSRARELHQRLLDIRRQNPETHPEDLAYSLRALAGVVERQGDGARARALRREAAEITDSDRAVDP